MIDMTLRRAVETAAERLGESPEQWLERAVRNQLIEEYRDLHGRSPAEVGRRCLARGCANPRMDRLGLCQPCAVGVPA